MNKNRIAIRKKGAQTNQESKNTEIMAENQLLSSKLREATREITELANERGQLKREIEDLNDNVINSLLAERDEVHEYRREERKKFAESTKELERLRKECSLLKNTSNKNEYEQVKTVECNDSGIDLKSYCKVAKGTIEEGSKDSGINLYENEKCKLEAKEVIKEFADSIKENFNQVIEKKVEEFISNSSRKTNYASKLKEAIKEQNNEQFENRERNSRANNIIVHRMNEINDGKTDEERVKELFEAVGIDYKPL